MAENKNNKIDMLPLTLQTVSATSAQQSLTAKTWSESSGKTQSGGKLEAARLE